MSTHITAEIWSPWPSAGPSSQVLWPQYWAISASRHGSRLRSPCIMAVSARALPLETPAIATVDFGSLRTIHRFGIFLLWSLCRERQAMPQVKGPPGILSNSSIRSGSWTSRPHSRIILNVRSGSHVRDSDYKGFLWFQLIRSYWYWWLLLGLWRWKCFIWWTHCTESLLGVRSAATKV